MELLGFWSYLLLKANHSKNYFTPNGIKLKEGQILTGRKAISQETGLNESKIERILSKLEIEHQIEQQKTSKYRIISIINWGKYQSSEHQIEQQVNNKRTTSEHIQEHKNIRTKEIIESVIDFLNEKTGKSFKKTTNSTKACINARLKEGFTLDDFKSVIETKSGEWRHDERMSQYLRPSTLFGSKFESYLQDKKPTTSDIEQAIENSVIERHIGKWSFRK